MMNASTIKEYLNGKKEFLHQVAEARTYVKSPSEAPKGASLKKGTRGGMYYEDKPSGEQKDGKVSKPSKPKKMSGYDPTTPDYHQQLMDKAYDKFGDEDNLSDWYNKLDYTEKTAVAIGKLNQQVENGGFLQWYDNGYANVMVNDAESILDSMEQTEEVTSVLKLLQEYKKIKSEYDDAKEEKYGYGDDDDDDYDGWEDFVSDLSGLNNRFYKSNEGMMAQVNKKLGKESSSAKQEPAGEPEDDSEISESVLSVLEDMEDQGIDNLMAEEGPYNTMEIINNLTSEIKKKLPKSFKLWEDFVEQSSEFADKEAELRELIEEYGEESDEVNELYTTVSRLADENQGVYEEFSANMEKEIFMEQRPGPPNQESDYKGRPMSSAQEHDIKKNFRDR